MTQRSHRTLGTVLLALGSLLLVPETAFAQCAMCRRAFASPEGQQMMAAFRTGIIFLFIAPLAVFGTVATLAVRAQKRRNGSHEL